MSFEQSNAHQICERFRYPLEIENLLDELCVIAQQCIPSLRSILLSGSVATGDLVYRKSKEGLKIFSDLDVVAFAEGGGVTQNFHKELRRLEEPFRTPLFHIDFSLNTMDALRRLPPSYQMVELQQSEALLCGEDLRSSFPKFADAQISKQAFVMNLWKVLLYWPDREAARQECFQWVLARLILDIPLLVLSELGKVIPGHGARARAFCDLSPTDHVLAQPWIQHIVERAASMRRCAEIQGADLWPSFLELLDAVLKYLGLGERKQATEIQKRVGAIQALLPRRTLRRMGGEARVALHCSGNFLLRRLYWFMQRKEAWAGAAAIEMIAYLADESDQELLRRTEIYLSHFLGSAFQYSVGERCLSTQFCEAYWAASLQLYPSMRSNNDFVYSALSHGRSTPRC